ncbi:hypothetical protein [Nonomuraea sp. NPDC049480]|uniref:hypothetical protein n=1 Tax=Nonomuraea sp. NPDC049480 TaxID=3364353 RepID=UPI0037AFC6E7
MPSGEQQRAAIARALGNAHPCSNLDLATATVVAELLVKDRRGDYRYETGEVPFEGQDHRGDAVLLGQPEMDPVHDRRPVGEYQAASICAPNAASRSSTATIGFVPLARATSSATPAAKRRVAALAPSAPEG